MKFHRNIMLFLYLPIKYAAVGLPTSGVLDLIFSFCEDAQHMYVPEAAAVSLDDSFGVVFTGLSGLFYKPMTTHGVVTVVADVLETDPSPNRALRLRVDHEPCLSEDYEFTWSLDIPGRYSFHPDRLQFECEVEKLCIVIDDDVVI